MLAKNKLKIYILSFLLMHVVHAYSQKYIPDFTVSEKRGALILRWKNPSPDVTELILQRSIVSSGEYTSIFSKQYPNSSSNIFVIRNREASKYFYRIQYVGKNGKYSFSAPRKLKSYRSFNAHNLEDSDAATQINRIKPAVRNPKTSLLSKTLKPAIKIDSTKLKLTLSSSSFLFTDEEGNLIISLPDATKKKYSIKVFNEDGSELFQIKPILESQLLIDRSNFYRSGWFRVNLYDGTLLKEKNKFFVPPIRN